MSSVCWSNAESDDNNADGFGKIERKGFCLDITGLYLVKSAEDRKLEINTA
jgi:hypothetical protein